MTTPAFNFIAETVPATITTRQAHDFAAIISDVHHLASQSQRPRTAKKHNLRKGVPLRK